MARGSPTRAGPAALRRLAASACVLAALLAASGCADDPRAPADRPNVVLIFVDDLGYNDVGYNGAADIRTPNIDRLAAEGVVFSNGYVAHPFCGPSRAGLMTSRYPARFGMEHNLAYAPDDPDHGLPVDEPAFAEGLQDAGYRTGLVGKWQLGAALAFHPLNRGFDYFYGFLGGAHDYFRVDPKSRPGSDFAPLNDGFAETDFDGYLTDALTDRAVDFINEDGGVPFFLYLAYNAPHTPLQAPDNLVRKYSRVDDPDRRVYLAMIDSLDQNVGRVLDALDAAGKRESTLVFFLSDNGGVSPTQYSAFDWADNAPFRDGKNSFHEGGVRVPFIGSWPGGWPQGALYEEPVISLDVGATALTLAGAEHNPASPLDGVDLTPYVRGESEGAPHEALFWRQWSIEHDLVTYAVRSGDMKLVKDDVESEAALYDLASDPAETRDVTAERPDEARRLAMLWNDWTSRNPGNLYPFPSTYDDALAEARRGVAEEYREKGTFAGALYLITPPSAGELAQTCSNGVAVPDPDANPGLLRDCEALMSARDAIAGSRSLDWSFAKPISTWEGVRLSAAPSRVTWLALRRNELDGTLPPEFGRLSALQRLGIQENPLKGPLPPEWGNLRNLTNLVLHDAQATGTLPPEWSGMARLRELWLGRNRLTGEIPKEWGNLTSLRIIQIGGNELSGCVPPALREIRHDFPRELAACEE